MTIEEIKNNLKERDFELKSGQTTIVLNTKNHKTGEMSWIIYILEGEGEDAVCVRMIREKEKGRELPVDLSRIRKRTFNKLTIKNEIK